MNSPEHRNGLTAVDVLCLAWLVVVAAAVSFGWLTSLAGATRWSGVLWLVVLAGLAVRFRSVLGWALTEELGKIWRGERLVLCLGLVLVVVALSQTPGVHDSLAYRIPRIRWWLQEGGLSWCGSPDERINILGRNWEWTGLAIFSLIPGERLLTLPSLASWFVIWRCLSAWGHRFLGEARMAVFFCALFLSSPLLGGQASTTINDLFACGLVAVSAHFFLRALDERGARAELGAWCLVLSGFSLALATGGKPNFSIALPLWCLAALVVWHKHLPALPWKHLLWVVPVAALCSSIPTLFLNLQQTGHLSGLSGDSEFSVAPKNGLLAIPVGHAMFWWQSFQPSFNPLAGVMNKFLEPINESLADAIPRVDFAASPFRADGGGYWGVFATLVVIVGALSGLRVLLGGDRRAALPVGLLFLMGLVGLSANFYFAIPSTLGRSSGGFVILLLPLVLLGWGQLQEKRWVRPALLLLMVGSLASFALFLCLRPSRPALGVDVAAGISRLMSGAEAAEKVRGYRDRIFAGRDLYQAIPREEQEVAIIQSTNACLAEIWRSVPEGARIHFFRPEQVGAMAETGAKYAVAIPPKLETAVETYPELLSDPSFEIVERREYRQLSRVPPQSWYLLRRTR